MPVSSYWNSPLIVEQCYTENYHVKRNKVKKRRVNYTINEVLIERNSIRVCINTIEFEDL